MAGSGDDAATHDFSELFRELLPKIRAFARRRGGAEIVEDVASETFLVVWRRWADAPHEPDARRAWVYGIARNKIAHALGDAARQRQRVDRLTAAPAPAPAPDAADDVIDRERVARLLDLLPDAEREAFALTVWDGLSVGQAAAVLGCSVTALSSRLTRARRKLERAIATERQQDLKGGNDDA